MIGDHVRVGAFISPNDPFWVLVRDAVYRQLHNLGAHTEPFEFAGSPAAIAALDPDILVEEILARQLKALICNSLPDGAMRPLLHSGLRLVYLSESTVRHPLLCSPTGLYTAAQIAAHFIAQRLAGRGRTVVISGMADEEQGGDSAVSRLQGYCDTMQAYPEITTYHIPTLWRYDQAYAGIQTPLAEFGAPVDAVFGMSDSLALAARDVGRQQGIINDRTVIVGLNGDPLALAAIAEGSMMATVETSAERLGYDAAMLAYQSALGQALPAHYMYETRLITAENVADVALKKLVAIADIPTQLVGFNQRRERNRLLQLETSVAINRRVGALLDRKQLLEEITDIIRTNYHYDDVQLFSWLGEAQELCLEVGELPSGKRRLRVDEDGLLGAALRQNEALYIPDTHRSHRFAPDPERSYMRARVVLPVRLGEQVLGVLDLHSRQPKMELRWEVIGLQLLAEQLGIAMRNAELYANAVQAQAAAERADQLKTRLIANVSHELRAPLNVILGYSQTALNTPNPYGVELPEALLQDFRYIYHSGVHLSRIINDLLDLSRAEIGALDLYVEAIEPRLFLEEIFYSIARSVETPQAVVWNLCLPQRLPLIQADAVRLRQILLNLLSNAAKFTQVGHITLGAAVEPPYIHLWVSDTGIGIPVERQEQVFEPFVTVDRSTRRREGIGLGLTVTRHLVALHGGLMSLESTPERGSTFHVYLPLPTLGTGIACPQPLTTGAPPGLVVLTSGTRAPDELCTLAHRQDWKLALLHPEDDLEALLHKIRPVALAWDMRSATANDWPLIHRLRSHSYLSQLSFMLFGQDDGDTGPGVGITNVLLKPLSGRLLADVLDGLCAEVAGTILIVDDDAHARALYRRIIDEALPGFVVREAENGAQALALLEAQTPCLIILDLMMPEVDGFTVLAHIRATPATQKTPVVVVSGKVLTFDDVQRLNHARVVVQSKGILTTEEIVASLRHSLDDDAGLSPPTSVVVKYALAYLHRNYAQDMTRKELAAAVGVSESYLSQIFHQEMGVSLWEFLNRLRIQQARTLLRTGDETVTEIALRVGFNDSAYFSRVFRRLTGCSPSTYRAAPITRL